MADANQPRPTRTAAPTASSSPRQGGQRPGPMQSRGGQHSSPPPGGSAEGYPAEGGSAEGGSGEGGAGEQLGQVGVHQQQGQPFSVGGLVKELARQMIQSQADSLRTILGISESELAEVMRSVADGMGVPY